MRFPYFRMPDAAQSRCDGKRNDQKLIFAPNCMRRGARKLLICPNTVLVFAVLANPFGLTQFNVFCVSQRSCSFQRPSLLMLKFFISDMSVLKNPGPRTV